MGIATRSLQRDELQGLSVRAVLSSLRNLVAPQNVEIGAAIFADQRRRAFISVASTLAERRQLGIFEDLPPEYAFESGASDAETAFRIACFLVWIRSSPRREPDTDRSAAADSW